MLRSNSYKMVGSFIFLNSPMSWHLPTSFELSCVQFV
jgi:hypothetical protein